MKVGDKKKVLVLGAIAVVVVSVAVVRILPHSGRATAGGTQARDATDGRRPGGGEGSEVRGLVSTPFSHPLLAERESPDGRTGGGAGGTRDVGDVGHTAGDASGTWGGPLVFLPEGGPESSQESEQVPRAEVILRLQAVVHAGRPVAILEVNGKTVRAGEGAELMDGWKVIAVSGSGVTLKGADGERTVRVGETFAIHTPSTAERPKEG